MKVVGNIVEREINNVYGRARHVRNQIPRKRNSVIVVGNEDASKFIPLPIGLSVNNHKKLPTLYYLSRVLPDKSSFSRLDSVERASASPRVPSCPISQSR